jgi:hypothetical protein
MLPSGVRPPEQIVALASMLCHRLRPRRGSG